MKSYYQPKGGKKGNYALRENTYRRIWYLIADYPYFKELQSREEQPMKVAEAPVGYEAGAAGGVTYYSAGAERPGGHSLREGSLLGYKVQGSPFQYREYIAAIESAKAEIPEIYVDAVMSHIIDKKKYKDMDGVSERAIKIWVQRFIWHVANKLGDV